MFGMVLACQEVNGYSHVVRSNIIHFMKVKEHSLLGCQRIPIVRRSKGTHMS